MDAWSGPRKFATTRWSLVKAAGDDESEQRHARTALEELCRMYWYPLYAFVRSRGYGADDAQDLTQAFFTRIIETTGFASANRERGRFRSYLLGAMKHFLANEWHRQQAEKRGGGIRFLEWEGLDPESRYEAEAGRDESPETLFDREWALETISGALRRLRDEMAAAGKQELFENLKGNLSWEEAPVARSEAAARLNLSAGAMKVAIHRLRHRYRDLLRAAIAETVACDVDVDDEMRYLVAVLRRG